VPFGFIVAESSILLALPVLTSFNPSVLLELYRRSFCGVRLIRKIEALRLDWLRFCLSNNGLTLFCFAPSLCTSLSLISRRPSRLRTFPFFRLLLSTAYCLSSGLMGSFCFAFPCSRASLTFRSTLWDFCLLLATYLRRGPLRAAALLGTLCRLCRLFAGGFSSFFFSCAALAANAIARVHIKAKNILISFFIVVSWTFQLSHLFNAAALFSGCLSAQLRATLCNLLPAHMGKERAAQRVRRAAL
jgi:hypothetical protein